MNKIIHTLRILALLAWPVVTWASAVTLGKSFGQLELLDILAVVFLSLFSGGVALLQRMEREAAPAVPWRWISTHMSVALLAGMLAFLIGEAANLEDHVEALSIAISAWLGARFIERLADNLLDKMPKGPHE